MATGTNGIATEGEAKSKLGYNGSVNTNKCCTKARAVAMGADSSKLSAYKDNQLVKYDDIFKLVYIDCSIIKNNEIISYSYNILYDGPLTYKCMIIIQLYGSSGGAPIATRTSTTPDNYTNKSFGSGYNPSTDGITSYNRVNMLISFIKNPFTALNINYKLRNNELIIQ